MARLRRLSARALTPPPPPRPAACAELRTGFLSFDELADFYRDPDCAGYYYPPVDAADAAARDAFEAEHGRAPLCVDEEWTFYRGTRAVATGEAPAPPLRRPEGAAAAEEARK